MKIITIIQARMSSTRLHGKVMMPLCGQPLLARMTERVRHAELSGSVVVATTTDSADNEIEYLCEKENIDCYRGDPTNLLDRHYQVAKRYAADVVLKIPSDCPLIDHRIINKVITFYKDNVAKYDYVSNLHPASYPDGNDVELMTFPTLERTWNQSVKQFEKEHTTPYIWENPDVFRIGNVLWETGKDYSRIFRWTVDYKEDYEFIKRVYNALYPLNPKFSLDDILELIKKRPALAEINKKFAGEYWYKNHVNELKTINYQKPIHQNA